MGFDIGSAAAGAIGPIMGAFGIGAKAQDRRQVEQQRKLQGLAIEGSKAMTDYQHDKQMQMWRDTNWSAQMKEAEKAGLSTAWLMGKGGGTVGQMGSGGMSISGGNAADAASTQNAQTASQMAIAQMENIQANTEKTKAETTKIGGVDTANVEANTALTQANKAIQEVAARVANETEDKQVEAIVYAANEQVQKAREQFNKAQVSEESQQATVAKIKAEAIGAGINNILMEAQVGKTRAETRATAEGIKQKWEQVSQGWKGLDIQEKQTKIMEFKNEIDAQYPGIWNVAGRAIDDMITQIVTVGGTNGERHKTKTIKK